MKKIALLGMMLLLGGCSSLFETPVCLAPAQPVKSVARAELVAVIGFANDSSEISAQNKEVLQQVADKAIKEKALVMVYGHASHRAVGNDVLRRIMVNLKISNERAVRSAAALIGYGVPIGAVNTIALMDSRPLKKEVDAATEAANRRAEIYLYWLED